MEVLILTVLSVFAFVGVIYTVSVLLEGKKPRMSQNDFKLILYLPENSVGKLEGIVRQIYSDGIPGKLSTDGKVYLIVNPADNELLRIIESLKTMYSLEVLPDPMAYSMINDIENRF
jgi:hypothetical protein